MKTMVIAAHRDDEVLSTGGLILKRVREGHTVAVCTMYGRRYVGVSPERQIELDREQARHTLAAGMLLGYQHVLFHAGLPEGEPSASGYYEALLLIERAMAEFGPDEVIIPSAGDLNQDHRHLNEICRIALRPGNRATVQRVLEAMAHDTHSGPEQATYGVSMSLQDARKVLDAMECYETEVRQEPHPRSRENMLARWKVYGAQFGVAYAEPYKLLVGLD